MKVDYSKINSMWDVLVTDTSKVEDMQRFTQQEKDFVIDFLAGVLDGLTNMKADVQATALLGCVMREKC